MRLDRIVAAAFVVLVSTAIIGFSTGNTGASFTGATTNPNESYKTENVAAPASQNAPASAIAGRVDLSWPATATPANGHAITYLVFRNGTQIGATAGLAYSDTPGADGTNSYTIQTKIAQGAGFFTSAHSPAQNGTSDRTAPAMSATCNAGACGGWFNTAVTFVVSGNDGTGVGMGSATTSVDAAGAITSAAPRTMTVSGDAIHSVVFSGADAVGNASGTTTQTVKIDTTAPTAATGFTSAKGVNPGEIVLTWTAGADTGSGVAGYTIYNTNPMGPGGCPVQSTTNYPNSTSVGVVTGTTLTLTRAKKYCFYFVTNDVAGNASAPSATVGPQHSR